MMVPPLIWKMWCFHWGGRELDGFEMKELTVKEVRAVDAYTVDIETNGANPLLVNNLTNMFMMDMGWSEANDVMTPHDVAKGETNFATSNSNTGWHLCLSAVQLMKDGANRQPELLG